MDWFKFYPGRFLIGSAHLSNEEAGCYIRLLSSQALKGSLPQDFKKLSHIAGGMSQETWEAIADKFPIADDGLRYNPRLSQVVDEARLATEAARESGRKGGLARAAKAKAKSSDPSSDPSRLAQQTEKQNNRERDRSVNTNDVGTFPPLNSDDPEMEKFGWCSLLSEEFKVDRVKSLQAVNKCFARHDPIGARKWLKDNISRSRQARSPAAYFNKILKSEFGL